MRHRWPGLDLVLPLAIVALTLLVYSSVGGHGFLRFDDDLYVTANPVVRDGLSWSGFLWSLTAEAASNWHPATWWSHMIDVDLFGLEASGHHWTNVALHGLSAVLLFLFFRLSTGSRWRSSFVAAVFALHPLHVQSVAWIAERKDVLSTVFAMLALLAYRSYAASPAFGRYLLVTFLFLLGLLAKPMVVTLPFLLLLLDHWPLRRKEPWSRRILEKVPLLALSAAVSAVTLLVQSEGGAVVSLPTTVRLANAVTSYGRYLSKAFWPDGLAAYYPHPGIEPVALTAAAAVVLVVTVIALRAWRSRPWLPVGWFWYLGMLVPVLGLVQVGEQAMADRYTYVPLVGISVVVAWGAAEILGRSALRAAGAALLVTTVGLLAFRTRIEVGYWENDTLLFERALAVTRENDVAHAVLGVEKATRGDLEGALHHQSEAVRIDPNWVEARTNLGRVLLMKGRPDEAEVQYRAAIGLGRSAAAHAGLASALLARRDVAGAIAEYERALQLEPRFAEALSGLATAYTVSGDPARAAVHFEQAIAADPAYVDAHVNYGITLEVLDRPDEARAAFRRALDLQPGHPVAAKRLENLSR